MKVSRIGVAVVLGFCAAHLFASQLVDETVPQTVVAAEQVGTRIVMLDPAVVAPANARVVWEWKPAKDVNVNAAGLAGKYANPSECKMSHDRTKILMCSSENGFAVVDVATTNAVACGCVANGVYANLHSISELPDGNVVLAGSERLGLIVVDLATPCSSSQPQTTFEYPGAHGVIWDWDRNCLWATGTSKLSRLSYDPATKTLSEEKSWAFPSGQTGVAGHDLVWKDAAHTRIVVTGGTGLMYLDMANADTATTLSRHETQLSNVKGLSYYGTERLTLIPDGTGVKSWQSCNITVQGIGRKRTYSLSGAGFYKAHFYADADGGTTVEEPVEFPDGRTVVFHAEEYESTNMDASRVTSEVTNILIRGGGALIGAPIPDYTGPITVEKGVLSISSASCLGSPGANPINIMSGASLFATNCPDNILSGRTINLYGGYCNYWTPLGAMKGKIRLCAASNLAIGTNVCINLKDADSAIYLCGNEWGSFKLSSGTIDLGGRTLTIESNWKRFETGATIKNGGALETKNVELFMNALVPKFQGAGTIKANYAVNIQKPIDVPGWTLVQNGNALHGNVSRWPVNAAYPVWSGPVVFTNSAKVADYAGTSSSVSNTIFTLKGTVSGAGTLSVGPGWLNLAGAANTYSGAVSVNGMSAPDAKAPILAGGGGIGVWLGAAVFPEASSVALTNSARIAFMDDVPAALPKLTFDGAADQSVTGGGCTNEVRSTLAGLEKNGTGTLTVASPVRMTAPAVVKGGTLKISTSDPRDGRRLVWSDDFSGSSLDSSKWTTEAAMRSSGMQITYNNNSPYKKVENGTLHFAVGKSGSRYVTTDSVVTKNLMAFKYGYLEMRAKVPYLHGAWPSLWMKAQPGLEQKSWMSEIDIFEVFPSRDGQTPVPNIHKWTWAGSGAATPHEQLATYRRTINYHYDFPVTENLSDEYHVYGFEWTEDKMSFYVDGCRYTSFDLNDDFYNKSGLAGMDGFRTFHYILLNNELMTRDHDAGSSWINDSDLITSSDPLPEYTVDWIRLWQKDGEEARTKSGGSWTAVASTGGTNVASRPAVDEMDFYAGTRLDLAGTPSYSVARLKGSPAVTNAVSFAVTERWTLTGSAAMSVDGALSFGPDAEFALADESAFASVTSEGVTVATATGGIVGVPASTGDNFVMRLSSDGKSLILFANVPEPQVAAASDVAGFDYTNRLVTVTNATTGATLTLTATASDGTTTTATATVDDNGEATFDISTTAGTAYSYVVSADGAELASGGFLTGAWNESGTWFSASAESGESVVSGGEWNEIPAVSNSNYAIDGTVDFALTPEAVAAGSNRLVRVDFDYAFDSFVDAGNLADESEGKFGVFAASVDLTGAALWMAFGLDGCVPLYGDVAPEEGRRFVVRAEAEFAANPPRIRYEVSEDGGTTFAQLFTNEGRTERWVTGAVSGNALSGVGFDGQGTVASLGGAFSNANVAEADGVGYESLADAIAAATNSLVLLTNATWPTNTPVGTTAVSLGGYALQGVTLDGNGKAVVQSGYSAIPGEGKVNISLAQAAALGVATANKSPAQIAAALAANGANGIPLWKSYVLGLDPAVATAKPQATIVMNGENVELALVGINVNEGAGATVTYKVYKFADLSNIVEQPVGDDRDIDAPAEIKKGAAEPKMFYRLKIDIKAKQ